MVGKRYSGSKQRVKNAVPQIRLFIFQNKQKIMRISSYFFDPIFSDIDRRIWSNCTNELTVKAR